MLKSSVPKSSTIFKCEFCNYNTSRISQYDRHILTSKHNNRGKSTDFNILSTEINKKSSEFICHCGKEYKIRDSTFITASEQVTIIDKIKYGTFSVYLCEACIDSLYLNRDKN